MKSRIKKIRRELDLTQQEFADKLGIKRGAIANYEVGRNEPVDAVVSLICKTFNVSETWLRTGEGDMFVPAPDDELEALARKYNMDQTERKFFEEYLRLNEAERSAVSGFLRKVCSQTDGADSEPPADLDSLDIDKRVALYRQELEREEKAKAGSSALRKDA